LNLTSLSFASGNQHIILLVNGNLRISTPISIPSGSILIIAASGTITIDKSVGNQAGSSTGLLEGLYSSEKNIILESKFSSTPCQTSGDSDLQLTVNGSLIADALHPFSTDGNGSLINNRTLCANNPKTPALIVKQRLDFLTSLTDFYKPSSGLWKEVNP